MWQIADLDLNYNRESDAGSMLRFEYGFHADVSPDGSSIVYSTCEYPDDRQVDPWEGASRIGEPTMALQAYEIAVVDINGSERMRLTKAEGFVNYPSWSPGGEYIAIVANVQGIAHETPIGRYHYSDESVRITLIAADGTSPQDVSLARFRSPGRVALFAPVWSPSGRQLAYLVYEGEEYPITTAVFVIDLDRSLARIGQAVSPPTWSPDGEELAFVSVEEEEVVVYASSPDGAVQREVWRGTGGYGQAHWSPDGTEILVITDRAYLVSTDGGEQRALVDDRTVGEIANTWPIGHAAWSPDGSTIALRDEFSISMVSRDGTNLRVLVEINRDGQVRAVQPTQPEATAEPATGSPTPVQPN